MRKGLLLLFFFAFRAVHFYENKQKGFVNLFN